jgi:hypothetical protein
MMPESTINRYPITIEGESAMVGTANELAIALDVLQGQYDHEALVQLRPHLAEIVRNAAGLMTVTRSLGADDLIFLFQALGLDLVDVMQSAGHLRDLLATLSDQRVEETLLSTLGTRGLQRLITTGTELAEVMEWVYGEQDALMLDLVGDKMLRHLCRSAANLSMVLRALNFDLQARLLEQLGWPHVIGLVDDARDLACLLRALPPAHSGQLLRHFSGQRLKELIGHAAEWEYLLQRLEPAEAELLIRRMELA